MRQNLNESMPALVPEHPVKIAGYHLKLRFDVNVNKTKKGIKLQFVMNDVPNDQEELQNMTNEIGAHLQEKFGSAGLQIIQDLENPYRNVIGFLLPLPSVAKHIMQDVLKGEGGGEKPQQKPQEEPQQDLPDQETAAPQQQGREPMMEWMKKMAGLK